MLLIKEEEKEVKNGDWTGVVKNLKMNGETKLTVISTFLA